MKRKQVKEKRRKRQQQEEEEEEASAAVDEADQPDDQLQVNMAAECSPEQEQVHRSIAPQGRRRDQRMPHPGNRGNRRQETQPQAEYDIIVEPSPSPPCPPPQSRPRVATPGLPSAKLLPLQSRLARTAAGARGGTVSKLNGTRNATPHLPRPTKGLKASLDAFATLYSSAKPHPGKRTVTAANQKVTSGRRAANGRRESGKLQSCVADDGGGAGENQWGSSAMASTPVSIATPGSVSVMSATPPKDADMDLEDQDSPLQNTHSAAFRSGPSSMVELRSFEDDEEDQTLPSTLRSPCSPQLTAGVCGPELRPLTLDSVDSNNFTAWIRQHWTTSRIKFDAQLCAGHFRWYTCERRALGHRIDQLSSSHISGKLVLGSHMRKPVPQDTHPTTIFTVCTGSVRVRMSSVRPAIYDPGHVFRVPQGEAYTLDNMTPVPCVLVYHQLLPEGSETSLKCWN